MLVLLPVGDRIAWGDTTRTVTEIMLSSDHTTAAPWQTCSGACDDMVGVIVLADAAGNVTASPIRCGHTVALVDGP